MKYEVTSPDGKRFEITAPDGATEQDVLNYAQQQFSAQPKAQPKPTPPPTYSDVAVNAAAKGAAAGVEAPLSLASLGTKALASLPFAGHFPGLQTLAQEPELNATPMQDLGRQVGVIRPAMEPQTTGQKILDVAVQTGAGAGPGAVVRKVGDLGRQRMVEALARQSRNAVNDETLAAAMQEGYKVLPAQTNPSALNTVTGSIAGKAALKQDATIRNQDITNALARRAVGLPSDAPITEAALKGVRDEAGQVYEQLGQLRPTEGMDWFPRYHDTDLIEQLKKARQKKQDAYTEFWKSGKSEARESAEGYATTEKSLEADLERLATANAQPELIRRMADARMQIAKAHDIERALNLGDADVNARAIGRQLDKGGVESKTGELNLIGRFAQGPGEQVTREGTKVPPPGPSATKAFMSSLLAAPGAVSGHPEAMALAVMPWLDAPARKLVLSKFYQTRFAMPTYTEGQYLSQLPDPTAATTASAMVSAMQQRQDRR